MFEPNDEPDASLADHLEITADRFTLRIDDIVGLEDVKSKLQRTFYPGLQADATALHAPVVLLRGPSVAGTSRLGRAIAGELHRKGYVGGLLDMTTVRELLPHSHTIPEPALVDLLEELRDEAPAVLVLDQLDLNHLDDAGMVGGLVEEIRRNGERVACIITAGTTRHQRPVSPRERISIADFTFRVPAPDTTRRTQLLEATVRDIAEETSFTVAAQIDFEDLARGTDGFGRDELASVAKRAGQRAFTRDKSAATITHEDIRTAIDHVAAEHSDVDDQPACRGPGTDVSDMFAPERPDVTFDDIGGLNETIARVQEVLTFPDTFADVYEAADLNAGHGLLLHGPPGTGKTLLAKAIAAESSRSFYAVKGPEIKNPYFGETERRLRALFEAADEGAPSVLFFDEFDALAGARDTYTHSAMGSLVNTLLTELDGLADRGDILTVGATNRLAALDEAVLRPGRIDEQIACPPPDRVGQTEIFAIHSDGLPCAPDVTPKWFAGTAPAGVTGAEIEQICERAANYAMRAVQNNTRDELCVTQEDITTAIEAVSDNDDDDIYGFM